MQERRTDFPHVTTLLKDAGLIDTTWMTEYARDRGTAVHLAAALLHEDDLDEETLDPAVNTYLEAYKRFLEIVQPTDISCELPLLNEELGYCGTADRLWKIGGRWSITDLKCGVKSPWHRLQTAGYAGCYQTHLARFALYLRENGKFELVEHKGRADWPAFKAVLLLSQWRNLNK